MSNLVLFVWFMSITWIVAVAIKQLGFALVKGSLFHGLRAGFTRRARAPGFRGFVYTKLSELVTCRLCMTMQLSIWLVILPSAALGLAIDLVPTLLVRGGFELASVPAVALQLLASVLYGFGVSGLSLLLWNRHEYPVKRYETAVTELERVIFERDQLRQENEMLRSRDRAGTRSNHEEERLMNEADRSDAVHAQTLVTEREIVTLLSAVHNASHGIGCGYERRRMRRSKVQEWLRVWGAKSPIHTAYVRTLSGILEQHLPDYFREYSDEDDDRSYAARGVEDHSAAMKFAKRVVRSL